jgi:hypothetical protein
VNFGGKLFPAGTMLESSWRFYDLNFLYEHLLANTDKWALRASGGAGVMYSYATLKTQDGATDALVDDESFYPFLGTAVEHKFTPNWVLEVNANGMAINNNWILDTGAEFIWRPARAWDIALGYKYFSRKIETDIFYNKVNYNIPYLSFARFW